MILLAASFLVGLVAADVARALYGHHAAPPRLQPPRDRPPLLARGHRS